MKTLITIAALVAALAVPTRAATTQLNVLSFGARGDGTADDTLALQSALTRAASMGAQLYFPAGLYKVTAPLTFRSPNANNYQSKASIQGSMSSTISYQGTTNIGAILLIGGDVVSYGYEILDLNVLGNTHSTNAIEVRNVGQISMDNLALNDVVEAGLFMNTVVGATLSNIRVTYNERDVSSPRPLYGIRTSFCNILSIINPRIEKISKIGIWFDNNTLNSTIYGGTSEGNTFWPLGSGIVISGGSRFNQIINIDCEANFATYDVVIEGASHQNRIQGGYFDSGIYITNSIWNVIDSVPFRNLVLDTGADQTTVMNSIYSVNGVGGTITENSSYNDFLHNSSANTAVPLPNWLRDIYSTLHVAQNRGATPGRFVVSVTNAASGKQKYTITADTDLMSLRQASDDLTTSTNIMSLGGNRQVRIGDAGNTTQLIPLVIEAASTNTGSAIAILQRHGTNNYGNIIRTHFNSIQFLDVDYTSAQHSFGASGYTNNVGNLAFAGVAQLIPTGSAIKMRNIADTLDTDLELGTLTASVGIVAPLLSLTALNTDTLTTTNGIIMKTAADGPAAATIGAGNAALWLSNSIYLYKRTTADGITATDSLIP